MEQCIKKVTEFHQHIGAPIRHEPALLPCNEDEAVRIPGSPLLSPENWENIYHP